MIWSPNVDIYIYNLNISQFKICGFGGTLPNFTQSLGFVLLLPTADL